MNTQAIRPSLVSIEQSPIQRALDNYNEMERMLDEANERSRQLIISNNALTAEVNMLRDACERSDSDRVRLQAVASTLTGQLLAINAVIAEAMRTAIKNGVEAEKIVWTADQNAEAASLDRDGAEAQVIIRRITPVPPVVSPVREI